LRSIKTELSSRIDKSRVNASSARTISLVVLKVEAFVMIENL